MRNIATWTVPIVQLTLCSAVREMWPVINNVYMHFEVVGVGDRLIEMATNVAAHTANVRHCGTPLRPFK